MKLNTKESEKALKKFKSKTDMERIAIKVLLNQGGEGKPIPELITIKDSLEELGSVIIKIADKLGIDNQED